MSHHWTCLCTMESPQDTVKCPICGSMRCPQCTTVNLPLTARPSSSDPLPCCSQCLGELPWECGACTMVNQSGDDTCIGCDGPKPGPHSKSTTTALQRGETDSSDEGAWNPQGSDNALPKVDDDQEDPEEADTDDDDGKGSVVADPPCWKGWCNTFWSPVHVHRRQDKAQKEIRVGMLRQDSRALAQFLGHYRDQATVHLGVTLCRKLMLYRSPFHISEIGSMEEASLLRGPRKNEYQEYDWQDDEEKKRHRAEFEREERDPFPTLDRCVVEGHLRKASAFFPKVLLQQRFPRSVLTPIKLQELYEAELEEHRGGMYFLVLFMAFLTAHSQLDVIHLIHTSLGVDIRLGLDVSPIETALKTGDSKLMEFLLTLNHRDPRPHKEFWGSFRLALVNRFINHDYCLTTVQCVVRHLSELQADFEMLFPEQCVRDEEDGEEEEETHEYQFGPQRRRYPGFHLPLRAKDWGPGGSAVCYLSHHCRGLRPELLEYLQGNDYLDGPPVLNEHPETVRDRARQEAMF